MGNDHLDGMASDDVLVDGEGRDYVTGSGGRDMFVFVEDGEMDVIMDFEDGLNKIDLSQFSDVSSMADIEISLSCGGIRLGVNEDTFLIFDYIDRLYAIEDFDASDFVF